MTLYTVYWDLRNLYDVTGCKAWVDVCCRKRGHLSADYYLTVQQPGGRAGPLAASPSAVCAPRALKPYEYRDICHPTTTTPAHPTWKGYIPCTQCTVYSILVLQYIFIPFSLTHTCTSTSSPILTHPHPSSHILTHPYPSLPNLRHPHPSSPILTHPHLSSPSSPIFTHSRPFWPILILLSHSHPSSPFLSIRIRTTHLMPLLLLLIRNN